MSCVEVVHTQQLQIGVTCTGTCTHIHVHEYVCIAKIQHVHFEVLSIHQLNSRSKLTMYTEKIRYQYMMLDVHVHT